MSSPSAHSPSARLLEEAAELDAYIRQQAASVPSPESPHDSPGGAKDRDSSKGTPAAEQGDDPEFNYGNPDREETTLSPGVVAELAASFSIPPAFEPRAAGPTDRACRPPSGFVAIYKEQLVGGVGDDPCPEDLDPEAFGQLLGSAAKLYAAKFSTDTNPVIFSAVKRLSRLLGAPTEEVTSTTQPEAAKKAPEASATLGGSSAPQKEASQTQSPSKQVPAKKNATGQKRGRDDEPSQPAKKPAQGPAQRPLQLMSGGPVHLGIGSA
nr:uncharacterized protein LOC113704796 [Coffea arabica]